MTNVDPGSVAAAPAGTPGENKGGGDQGSDATASDAFAGLDTGTREWIGTKGYKTVADVTAAARNAESLIGRSVQIPADDAKPEDIEKFLDKATAKYRPKDADGYEFKLPEGVPKEMPYDADFAKEFKGAAHKLGLTARQAAAVHDFYVGRAAGAFTAQGEANGARASAATEALEKAWGKPDSETFQKQSDNALRAIKGLGGDELMASFREAGLFAKVGANDVVMSGPIAIALAKVGERLFKEDSLEAGSSQNASDNPFKDGPDKGNLTAQGILWNSDPEKAERLVRAAGFTPEQFGRKPR